MRLAHILLAAALAPALGGCFTGIESTPRISGAEVRRAGAEVSAEQTLTAGILPEPPAAWRPGKQWLVDDDKISLIFSAPVRTDSLRGHTLTLLRTDPYLGVAGDTLVELVFTAPPADTLHYRPGVTASDLRSRRSLEVPFTVELAPAATADSLLRGHTFYITTPNWRNASGRQIAGLRHVPVTVSRIVPGTAQYPLKVMFTPSDSTLGEEYSVLMTYGHGAAATRNFDRLFALENPRLKYPNISDDFWERIIHSRVALGMSRDEARLALGAPASIQRAGTNAGQYERWNYDQGIYLIFEDGVLIRFRQ